MTVLRSNPLRSVNLLIDRPLASFSLATEYLQASQSSDAKKAKADEFYTQLPDIEAELRHYRDMLRGVACRGRAVISVRYPGTGSTP